MRFQSKYRNHQIVIRPIMFDYIPGAGRRPIPGLSAKFTGPQRIFDLEYVAKERNWSDEDKETVLNWLLEHPRFMRDFFPAPGEQVPEDKQDLVRVKPQATVRRCTQIGYDKGQLVQCDQEASAGRDFCHKHDPETQTIKKGIGTTVG